MAGMGLSGGFAAGAGADALEEILKRAFIEQSERRRAAQEDQRIAQEGERLRMANADRDEARQIVRETQAQNRGLKLRGTLRPKQEITPEQVGTLNEAGFGGEVVAPTLASRNIGQNLTSTPNPGRGTSFAGTPEQLDQAAQDEELKRQIRVAAPALRGRLSMALLLPPDKRAGAIAEVMREEAKPPTHSAAYTEWQDAVANGYKGDFNEYQTMDANRKAAAAGGGNARPYYTYQPTYDATGRPTGAIRFDARGGPPTVVDVSGMTGGSQLKPPPGTTGAQAIGNEVSSVQLGRLKDMFDKGAKDLIGPVEGRARSVGQEIPGISVNEDFANFKAATAAFKNSVIKAITGAQLSEQEAKRIIQQIPTENDKPQVWQSKYAQTRANLGDLEKILAKRSGVVPSAAGGAQPAAPAKPATSGGFKVTEIK